MNPPSQQQHARDSYIQGLNARHNLSLSAFEDDVDHDVVVASPSHLIDRTEHLLKHVATDLSHSPIVFH
jgi:hypothetical protein